MKAVILAAGLGKRMRPLTNSIPKALIKIKEKPLLEYTLETVCEFVEEIIIIVGYKKEMINEYFGEQFKGVPLKYVEQKEQLGTGHALLQAEDVIDDRFIVLMGDDLYSKKDIESCLKDKYCILATEVSDPKEEGILSVKDGFLEEIEEKPVESKSNLANCGLYVLDKKIFEILKGLKKTERGEIELTDAVTKLAKKEKIKVKIVQDYWLPIGYPEHIKKVEKFLEGGFNG